MDLFIYYLTVYLLLVKIGGLFESEQFVGGGIHPVGFVEML